MVGWPGRPSQCRDGKDPPGITRKLDCGIILSQRKEVAFEGKAMELVIEEKELDQLPITIDPDIVSGIPVFRGTRVPAEALIDNLEAGLSLDEFLENFPTVTREQAMQVLEFSKSALLRLCRRN